MALKSYKIRAILANWLEWNALSRGISSIEVLGIPGGGPYRGISDFDCTRLTVACKVQKTPKVERFMGMLFSPPIPATELATRYRMKVENLELRQDGSQELKDALGKAKAYSALIESTPEYKSGMRMLGESLEKAACIDSDQLFMRFVVQSIKEHGGGQEQLREYMKETGWNARDVADLVGVTRDTVKHWMNGSCPIPEERLCMIERHIDDLKACSMLADLLIELKGNRTALVRTVLSRSCNIGLG